MKKPRSGLIIVPVLFAIFIYTFNFARTIIKFVFSILFLLIAVIFLKKRNIENPFKNKKDKEQIFINYDDIENMTDTITEDTLHKNEFQKNKSNKQKKVIKRKSKTTDSTFRFKDATKIYKTDSKDNLSGNKYIDELYLLSENLHGYMKEKTLEIIDIATKIFNFSEDNNLDSEVNTEFINKLTDTIKILNEYIDLSLLSFKTENTLNTMKYIESSMNDNILSYYRILNGQYEKILR